LQWGYHSKWITEDYSGYHGYDLRVKYEYQQVGREDRSHRSYYAIIYNGKMVYLEFIE
jgi:hypothetical protein